MADYVIPSEQELFDKFSKLTEAGLKTNITRKSGQKLYEEGCTKDDLIQILIDITLEQEQEKAREFARVEKEREKEIELARIAAQVVNAPPVQNNAGLQEKFDIRKFMQPFDENNINIKSFITLLENQLKSHDILDMSIWTQSLISLLPGKSADVISRLSIDDAKDYNKVVESLFSRYSISPEVLRQSFRNMRKEKDESYKEFIYRLKEAFLSWLKLAKADTSVDTMVEALLYEQFMTTLNDSVRLFLLDQNPVTLLTLAILQTVSNSREVKLRAKMAYLHQIIIKIDPITLTEIMVKI